MTDFNQTECVTAVNRLTPREREVLKLIAAGKAQKQIADALGISQSTVLQHCNAIYKKLEIHSAPAAVRVACAAGVV